MKTANFAITVLVVFSSLRCFKALSTEEDTEITSYENNNDGLGTYNFKFETSDGTSRSESGFIKNKGDPKNEILVVKGSYSYLGPDGIFYTVNYIADENGFRPQGDHIPSIPTDHKEPEEEPVGLSVDVLGSLLGRF